MRHGELEALRVRYKQRGAFFPEPFLWHVFHAFAEAASAMDSNPNWYPPGGEDDPFPSDTCIVHGDIKHANILVSDPPGPLDLSNPLGSTYPSIKLIDFGLAEITGADDDSNPQTFFGDARRASNHPRAYTLGWNGRNPFTAKATAGLMAQLARTEKLQIWKSQTQNQAFTSPPHTTSGPLENACTTS